MKDTEQEIRKIVAEVLEKNPEEITPEARFVEDLGMFSFARHCFNGGLRRN